MDKNLERGDVSCFKILPVHLLKSMENREELGPLPKDCDRCVSRFTVTCSVTLRGNCLHFVMTTLACVKCVLKHPFATTTYRLCGNEYLLANLSECYFFYSVIQSVVHFYKHRTACFTSPIK